ncbi:pre-mRNA-processing ATP-dependent RNA helicase prp5-like [Miscanthus floridulus]|uniref:pre-mRNA-processing ATP-dependent RNA helicase prp5-like n=1 Tax=Miscanthus floridulus TaxID=154761 RepID=UPI0034576019
MCEPPCAPVPKDVERRAENRAHVEVYKERKDAEEARRKRKSLKRDELEKRRREQRHDGLPVEPSPSSSSMDFSSDDGESEAGRGPLDDLPDVRETAPRASATGLVSLGGGGEDASRLAIAHPGAEADTPEIRVSGKRAISPMGSTTEVERATAGVTQPPPQRVEGASNRKRQAEAPALAPRKALRVSTSSTARWVVDVQVALWCGAASARADPKEPVAQGEATEAAMMQAGEEAPTPREAEAIESGEAEVPSIAEVIEGEVEAPRTFKAEVAEAGASRASEAEVADAGAPRNIEAEVAEAGAPGTTEAESLTFVLPIQELEARSLEKSMFLQRERDVWD